MSIIGERVRLARGAAKVSQKELAGKIGLSELSIIRLEKGRREPTIREVNTIAHVLGCTPEYLLGKGDMPTFISNVTPVPEPTGRKIKVPLLSPEVTACCGDGIPTYSEIQNEPDEYYEYTISQLGGTYDEMRPPYAVRADGACLEKSRIFDGDILIFNPALDVRQGKVHIVCWGGALSAKKVICNADGSVQLFSDVDTFIIPADEAADPDRFSIWGPVVLSLHSFK